MNTYCVIAQKQASYLKDTTDFLNFIERTKLPKNTILVSMDIISLYTNILQEEGITTVCEAYEEFYERKPPITTRYLREMLSLILQENSFQFNGKDYLQTHGTGMGTKMAKVEKELLRQSSTQYHPALPNLKDTIIGKWHLIESQPQLRNILKEPPIISYREEKSLKDILVKAKL